MKRSDNIFSNVMMPRVDTNRFDLSHDLKMSFQMGRLTPSCVMETMPGDKFNISTTNFLRFLPMLAPVMHRVRASTHYFFIPYRILWDQWTDFVFDPDSSLECPYVLINEVVDVGSLADYMGVPPLDYSTLDTPLKINLLPFAAYIKTYDEYFRQQGVQTELFQPIVPGDNTTAWLPLILDRCLFAAWEHDYFTSCLPSPQAGDGVKIPLTFQNDIPVTVIDNTRNVLFVDTPGNTPGEGALSAAAGTGVVVGSVSGAGHFDPNLSLGVDVQSDAALINDLRRAFRLQEFLEKLIRGGQRYIETLLSIFGVRSSDARLQRPEFIFMDKQNVVISEVLATTQSTGDNQALGQMGGHGISVGGGNNGFYKCEEHGVIIGLLSVRPDTAYQSGLHKMWERRAPLDFPLPDFANIGEQEVFQRELVANSDDADNSIFGYQSRYAEMKYIPSRVAGELRTTLNFWHLGRIFDISSPPVLNDEFISCNPSLRIFAVTDPDEDHIVAHVVNSVSVIRKLPRYGIPTI